MADNSSDDVSQVFGKSSLRVEQLWHAGAGQLPLTVLQAPLEVPEQVLKWGLSLAAEGMHGRSSAQRSQLKRHLYNHEADKHRFLTWDTNKILNLPKKSSLFIKIAYSDCHVQEQQDKV